MKIKRSNKKTYHAPLPLGEGIMVFEKDGKLIRLPANEVSALYSDKKYIVMSRRGGGGVISLDKKYEHAIEDMYLRAKRGEIARLDEYSDDGMRLDGQPLLMQRDMVAKAVVAQSAMSMNDLSKIAASLKGDEKADDADNQSGQDINELPTGARLLMPPRVPAVMNSGTENKVIKSEPIHEIGQMVAERGVYIGPYEYKWKPRLVKEERHRIFDVYTTGEDVQDIKNGGGLHSNFNNLVAAIARIENLHGHAGLRIETVYEMAAFMKSDDDVEALENWFVPSKDILVNQIHRNRAKGDLSGTFCLEAGETAFWDNDYRPSSYISTNIYDNKVGVMSFDTGRFDNVSKATLMSARPIRMELRAPK